MKMKDGGVGAHKGQLMKNCLIVLPEGTSEYAASACALYVRNFFVEEIDTVIDVALLNFEAGVRVKTVLDALTVNPADGEAAARAGCARPALHACACLQTKPLPPTTASVL